MILTKEVLEDVIRLVYSSYYTEEVPNEPKQKAKFFSIINSWQGYDVKIRLRGGGKGRLRSLSTRVNDSDIPVIFTIYYYQNNYHAALELSHELSEQLLAI